MVLSRSGDLFPFPFLLPRPNGRRNAFGGMGRLLSVKSGACNCRATRYKTIEERARSSAGEHCIDIAGVTGSIPVVPTMKTPGLKPGVFW